MALGAALGWASPAAGQRVRVTGTTSVRYIDVRPLVADSVPVETTAGDGVLRRSDSGALVRCVPGDAFCRFRRSGEPVSAVPATQDLTVSVWGLGRGVRAWAHVRGRGLMGSSEPWPRGEDAFDPLAAWVELDRSRVRLRGGRLWSVSGLGYRNFDGASVLVRAAPAVSIEAWGGWSLARGLNEPRTSGALEALETLAIGPRGLLVGARARWRPGSVGSAALAWEREVRSDLEGVYAEQLAADVAGRVAGLSLAGSLELDLAGGAVTEARLSARRPVGDGFGVGAQLRHYEPFFEAWTIWGAFAPVGFDEAEVEGWWMRGADASVVARAGWRRYPETHASATFSGYRDTAWRAGVSGFVRPADAWAVQGRLHTEIGFGAARNDASRRGQRDLAPGWHVGATATAFERVYEFRVAEGTVRGLGLDAAGRVGPRVRLLGALTSYRHSAGGDGPEHDWSQLRGSLRVDWVVGAEPGAGGEGG